MKVSDVPGYRDVVFRVEEVELPWENTGDREGNRQASIFR